MSKAAEVEPGRSWRLIIGLGLLAGVIIGVIFSTIGELDYRKIPVSPTYPKTKAFLFDRQKTMVRFWIGPYEERSAIPSTRWTVNPELLANKANVPLTITMSCSFCEGEKIHAELATYFGDQKRSSETVFEFTPLRSLIQDQAGSAQVGFEIASRGVQFDRFMVDVRVGDNSAGAGAAPLPGSGLRVAMVKRPEWARDVDLVILKFGAFRHC